MLQCSDNYAINRMLTANKNDSQQFSQSRRGPH
jgi:hypothetical protein